MAIITVTTDFGIKDGNVGVMKGVIWSICPSAQIADISHMIAPQNIPEASLVLARSAPYFPAGTIHLVVVDPGVGTERRPMAAKLGNWYFVGPDNGTITHLLEGARAQNWSCDYVALDNPRFWLGDVSHVFHGRDVFSPVAAHLANGVPLLELGAPFFDPVVLDLPQPRLNDRTWHGEIIHVDHFGNAASNIRSEHLAPDLGAKSEIRVNLGSTTIHGLVDTFGEREPGELVSLLGSTGNLIVSVVNGNAASRLGLRVGAPIEVDLPAAASRAHRGAA